MFKPEFKEFENHCRQGNRIPVYKEYLADLETPVSVLSRFTDDENVFLLESVEGGERWGRYSFLGINPFAMFKVENGTPVLIQNGKKEILSTPPEGPFTALRKIINSNKLVELPELPRFIAGAIGYIGYNTVREFELLPEPKGSQTSASACMMLTDEMIIFDNVRHTVLVVCCARPDDFDSPEAAYKDAIERIEAIDRRLKTPINYDNGGKGAPFDPEKIQSNISHEDFCEMVTKAKDYIVEGDIIQAVLSQRFSTELTVPPLRLYRALRLINPSPYTFFLKFENEKMLIGSSPEIMVKKTGSRAVVRPIAGTRPRGASEQEDRALADELLRDEKERAEHLMLVDLGRNDLGRIAAPSSVQVKDFMTIERYSHVMHLVSNVEAETMSEKDCFDLLRATFPAGTLSGAPKIRAMEIINELEPETRSAYGGAVGYIGFNGDMNTAITIRTFEIDDKTVSVQAGAGIVYDSDPETEYMETRHKTKALFKALELAANGLEI